MDPTATYEIMTDETREPDERIEAAVNLRGWLRGGGFMPDGLGTDGNARFALYADIKALTASRGPA